MAIFKSSNPEKAVQRDIDAATANRERLSAKLAESEQAVSRHADTAKQAALTGDDAELDRAEASLRAAQDRRTSLRTALTDVEQQLEALERKKAELADQKVRSETAAEIERLVRGLTEIGAEFDATAECLSEYTRRSVPIVYEALGLNNFIVTCRAQVPEALDMVGKLLRAHADAVIAGTAPAALPRGDDQASEQVPAPAQTPAEPHFKYRVAKAEPTYKGFAS
jgi:hypothetical protein